MKSKIKRTFKLLNKNKNSRKRIIYRASSKARKLLKKKKKIEEKN